MLLDFNSEIYALMRGALLFLSIYMFALFSQRRRRLYLYYAAYLLCLFIYFLKDVSIEPYTSLYHYVNFSILYVALGFYLAYGREILRTKKYIPSWDALMVIAQRALFLSPLLFLLIEYFFGYTYQNKLFVITMPIISVFAILTYSVFKKIKGKHVNYFIIGSVIFLVMANISFIANYSSKEYFIENYGFQPKLFLYVGAFIETLFFTTTIGYLIRVLETRKRETDLQLEKVTREMADLKMTVLQTQMDPHFLYNSLNSINNFVIQNDVEKASDYITKFARLIREILKNSSSLTVPLEDDLGVLGLYVKLEQMRTVGGFDYIVTIDDAIDLRDIQVPPLFMQPYIENAIWHGFANVKGYKKISLTIYSEEDKIRCEIIDNGVGIKKSKTMKPKDKRKPFGLKASEDRIKLLHENQNVYVIIEDISDHQQTGTKVTIKFPKKI